jgi:hypothetical protein
MHKYAAATALAVALSITMLTPAVSASNGHCYGRNCRCSYQCFGHSLYLATVRHCKPGAFCDVNVIPPDIHACLATCMAEKASRH